MKDIKEATKKAQNEKKLIEKEIADIKTLKTKADKEASNAQAAA